MSLRNCLGTPLNGAIKSGLGALSTKPRNHRVWVKKPANIIDSLYLDEAIKKLNPSKNSNKPRWDYLVSAHNDGIVGLEPHPSRPSEVDKVIAKKDFSDKILKNYLREECSVKAWFWVNLRPLAITPNSTEQKKLDGAGIKFSQFPLDIR